MCGHCGLWYPIEKMEADHAYPWYAGGSTHEFNGQMLCMKCHAGKTRLQDCVFVNVDSFGIWYNHRARKL